VDRAQLNGCEESALIGKAGPGGESDKAVVPEGRDTVPRCPASGLSDRHGPLGQLAGAAPVTGSGLMCKRARA